FLTTLQDQAAGYDHEGYGLPDEAAELADAFGFGRCCDHAGSARQRRLAEEAARQERRRLSQELHDGLAPALYLLTMKATALNQRVEDLGLSAIQAELQDLQRTSEALNRDLRELLFLLRGGDLDPGELMARIEGEVLELSMRAGTRITLRLCEDLEGIPPAVLVQILRIVQEGIRNIEKHAAAQHASVLLERRGEFLHLTIQDDGVGFDVSAVCRARGSHFGIHVIRERTSRLGGWLKIKSAPGKGCTLTVTVPLRDGTEAGTAGPAAVRLRGAKR
ncbi:MAG TPA: sensor histidine kinase, partial [Dehalococcoidia bacterium]